MHEHSEEKGKPIIATHVLSEDLPPFVQSVFEETLVVRLADKKKELQAAGFEFGGESDDENEGEDGEKQEKKEKKEVKQPEPSEAKKLFDALDDETKDILRVEKERILEVKKAEAQFRKEYHEKMLVTTTQNFKDRPDEVSPHKLLACTATTFAIEWKAGCDNNVAITHYTVYIKEEG